MKRNNIFIIGVGLGVLLLGGVLFVTHDSPLTTHHGLAKSAYYCPMHPSYTSNRPGDCPICNMKLVKAEAPGQASQQFSSICYLHNCSKLHEGKPCPMTVVAKPGEKVTCPICGTHIAEAATTPANSAHRKILYWTDPMIPGYKASGPGKSPMGMDLVPVYEEETGAGMAPSASIPEGYAPILLTPQKQQLVGVKTAPAQKRNLTKTIRTVGVIAHDPELYQVEQEFIQAYQGWQRAQASQMSDVTEQAKQLVDSSRLRLRHLGLSEEMIDEISTWTAPDHRLLLGGAGQFWVYASMYEYELPFVRAGQTAAVTVDAYPGSVITGTVKAIDPMVNPLTRTTRARIVVEDSQGVLRPEMYVNVSIAVNLGEMLAVPEEAVFATGTQHIVFIDKGQGIFEPRDVAVGAKADGYDEIKEGVSEGEQVVTSGNFLIDSESRLKGALQGMTPPPVDAPSAARPAKQTKRPSGPSTDGGVSSGDHQHGQ